MRRLFVAALVLCLAATVVNTVKLAPGDSASINCPTVLQSSGPATAFRLDCATYTPTSATTPTRTSTPALTATAASNTPTPAKTATPGGAVQPYASAPLCLND